MKQLLPFLTFTSFLFLAQNTNASDIVSISKQIVGGEVHFMDTGLATAVKYKRTNHQLSEERILKHYISLCIEQNGTHNVEKRSRVNLTSFTCYSEIRSTALFSVLYEKERIVSSYNNSCFAVLAVENSYRGKPLNFANHVLDIDKDLHRSGFYSPQACY